MLVPHHGNTERDEQGEGEMTLLYIEMKPERERHCETVTVRRERE